MKVLLAVFAVSTCFAQRYAAPARVASSSPAGFGSVAHPGTPSPIPYIPHNGIGARVGQPGRRAYQSYSYPAFGGSYYGSYLGSSSYYGDNSGYGYSPAAQQPPVNVTVVNAPPQVPTVIINQNYGPPLLPQQQPAPAEIADAPPAPHYFLVAFKDHSVYSALTYWVEGNTMHYVTPQQTHNQASLDLVDMEFTEKLNQH